MPRVTSALPTVQSRLSHKPASHTQCMIKCAQSVKHTCIDSSYNQHALAIHSNKILQIAKNFTGVYLFTGSAQLLASTTRGSQTRRVINS